MHNPLFELAYKEWESLIFDKNVYQLSLSSDKGDSLTNLLQGNSIKSNSLICSRISTRDISCTELFINHNFRLTECYLNFKHSLKNEIPKNKSSVIREMKLEDLNHILKIANTSFSYSRFHMDPQISKQKADLSRKEWVKNGCKGRADQVFIAEHQNQVAGFVLINKRENQNGNYGVLDLIAVSKKFRGYSLGKQLTEATIQYCQNQNFNYLMVGTQAHNITSVNLYEKCGFSLNDSSYSFHKHI